VVSFDGFAEAPFGPLGEHMAQVKDCVGLVQPMFACVRDQDFDKLKEISSQVFKSEHKADVIKDEIRRSMPRMFSLPIYRGDLLSYLKLQDDMADAVEDVAVVLTIKNLALPAADDQESGPAGGLGRRCERLCQARVGRVRVSLQMHRSTRGSEGTRLPRP